jgi:ATP/maltotriose-dependent transcriptional regulator MalT
MFKKILVFLILLNLSYTTIINAQPVPDPLDNLYEVIHKQKDTPQKVDALLNISAKDYKNLRPDILEEALEIAGKIYYIDGIAKAFDLKGLKERRKNNFLKSVEYHKRALSFFEKSTDTTAKINCIHNLSVSLRKLNFDKEAYKHYIQALDLANKIHDSAQIAMIYNGIGNVYVNTEEYDKALYYFKKSYELEQKRKNLKGQDYNLANIGEVYMLKNQMDSAHYYLDKTLALEKIIYKPDNLGVIYNLMGLLYKKEGKCKQSIEYYNKALPLLEKKNIKRYMANSLINKGICQTNIGLYKQGLKNIKDGIALSEEIKSVENISLGHRAMVNYYTKQNKYKEALEAYKKATDYHNKIVNLNTKQSILTTQVIYETKEKDEKIKKLALEKELEKKHSKQNFLRLIYTTLGSGVLIVFLYLFFRLRRKNVDLELAHKNAEIQNYVMKIKEMESKIREGKTQTKEELKEKLRKLGLTEREIDVLKLISEGFNNDEIAEKMFISKNTVKSHIKNIYVKLDVKNRIQAIKKIQQA